MSSIKYIDYNNKSILYVDLEGVASDHEVIDLGEKAKKLVKLGSRNKIYVLYNFTGVTITKNIILRISGLMENASLVERRVMFGLDKKYDNLFEHLIRFLRIDRNTKFSPSYTDAVNKLTDESVWVEERRKINIPVQEDKRAATPEVKEEFLEFSSDDNVFDIDWDFKA